MAMQNYDFDSVSLLPFYMIFNKVIYFKNQTKEEKTNRLWSTCYHIPPKGEKQE